MSTEQTETLFRKTGIDNSESELKHGIYTDWKMHCLHRCPHPHPPSFPNAVRSSVRTSFGLRSTLIPCFMRTVFGCGAKMSCDRLHLRPKLQSS